MPVPSQGHYGFHSFPVVDCLYQVRVITVFTVFRLLTFFVYILMSFDFPFVRLFGVRIYL